MRTVIHNNVAVSVYDMYGMVDLMSEETNRSAQIFYSKGVWELQLYWVDDGGKLCQHYEYITFNNKSKSLDAGVVWVVDGQWLRN